MDDLLDFKRDYPKNIGYERGKLIHQAFFSIHFKRENCLLSF